MQKKVLIVDDDPVIRVLIESYLSNQGYQVRVVEDGQECLNAIPEFNPDIVVLDLIMPIMNGVEVLQKLKSDSTTEKIPVVLLSSNTDTEQVVGSRELDANRYLQKPFNLSEILQAVETV